MESLRETRLIMGMPVTVEIADARADRRDALEAVFAYFTAIDERFSTYKETSEISRLNRGELRLADASDEMREVFALADATKRDSNGYFDMRRPDGSFDPSGIVKGWAIRNAARLLEERGYEHVYVEAGGDIQTRGTDAKGAPWAIGIRSPFNMHEIIKVVRPNGSGIATSGTSVRGQHIYNPHAPTEVLDDVVSLTVIGPDVFEADRYATAAFAMGTNGIAFIEHLDGFEGYEVRSNGFARLTSGLARFVAS